MWVTESIINHLQLARKLHYLFLFGELQIKQEKNNISTKDWEDHMNKEEQHGSMHQKTCISLAKESKIAAKSYQIIFLKNIFFLSSKSKDPRSLN